MKNKSTKKLVLAALFASLCCVSTMVIQIPVPTGYVNMGDVFVLLSAWVLGPIYGGAAAGIGSMLADIFSGYAMYALPTLMIKSTMAVVAALLFRAVTKHSKDTNARIISAFIAECIMVAGYYLHTALITGSLVGAMATIPSNGVQAVFALVASVALAKMLNRSHALNLT